ncbi:MAG: HPr family phosphocarrier protein [Syntrophales bacterium]
MVKTKSFKIINELGLHARAAALMVKVSNKFQSRIFFEKDGVEVDGKSILGILTLACPKGSMISIRAEGSDAREALEELGKLIENKFGEKN